MPAKTQAAPIDVATVVGLSSMPLQELQELQSLCAEQQLVASALLATRQAAGADLLSKRDALELAIDAAWDGDTERLEAEYSRLLPRLNTLQGMYDRHAARIETLSNQARDIAKYINQRHAEQGRQERAAEAQAKLEAEAAAEAARAANYINTVTPEKRAAILKMRAQKAARELHATGAAERREAEQQQAERLQAERERETAVYVEGLTK